MKRAFELSELGRGMVSPNPMVGCVVVKGGKVLGEGWHRKYGEAHAEVNAIRSVISKDELEGADLYVTLEPCSHYGKTPPCADLVVQYPFRRVVVANADPNPLVAGKGIEKIRKSGIEVVTGVMEEYGLEFNRRFFTFMKERRPYVILKWAETADGFIAREDCTSKWISNSFSRKLVHKWRAEEAGIMVGRNTAERDNPRLNVRDWTGNNPIRIVMDRSLQLSGTLHLFDGSQRTLCYNYLENKNSGNVEYIKISESDCMLKDVLADLYEKKIQSLIVEGGTMLLQSFIQEGLWDEIRAFRAPVTFGAGIRSPEFMGRLHSTEKILDDELFVYRRV